MTPEGDPVPRARQAARWLVSLAFLGLVAAGVVAAAVLLWRSVDLDAMIHSDEPAVEEVRTPGLAPDPAATDTGAFRVALLVSPESRPYFGEDGYYDSLVSHWTRAIRSAGGTVDRVSGVDGVAGLEPGAPVVVPAAPCLSYDAGRALYDHVEAGGGVVAEGPVGSRDEACEWRGWSLVRSLTGARSVHEVDERGSLYLTVPEATPLSHGSPPGARIEFGWDHQLALQTEAAAPYWSDWGLSPAPVSGTEAAATGALAAGVPGGGRVAWFGFMASQATDDHDRRRVRRVHRAAVLWAARRPVASLGPWPEARRGALLLTQDVEAEPQNARVMADVLESRGLPGTFFVVSDLVGDDPALAERLSAAGEIGSHTVDHRPLAGASLEDQVVRLRRSRETARSWADAEVAGLRPPEERFDRATVEAWSRVGGSYLAAENDGRSAAPELHPVPGSDSTVVLLPRLVKDDYNLMVMEGKSWEESIPALLESARKVHRLGGLAMLNVHTQLIDMGRGRELGVAVDSLRGWDGWWIEPAGRVASWWRARQGAGLELRGDGARGEIELRLAAPADTALVGATVDVTPGTPPGEWGLAPGAPARIGRSGGRLEVVVDSVPAGDTASVRLRRSPGGSGGPVGDAR